MTTDNNFTDKIALSYIKDKWSQYLNDTSHLAIRDKLENENAIMFYVLDDRYDKCFDETYFSGMFSFMGFHPPNPYVYYYSKKHHEMREIDSDFHFFSPKEIESFFYPKLTKKNYAQIMNRVGALSHTHIYQMFIISGIKYPQLVDFKYEGSFRYFFVSYNALNNTPDEKNADSKIIAKLEHLMNDWGITYEKKSDGILIDRVYKKK